MLSGRQVLESVDERLARAEREARAAQAEVDTLAARRDALRTEEAAALRDLARLRVTALQGGRASLERLDAAEAQALAALTARRALLADADARLAERRNAAAETAAARDAATSALRQAEAAARAKLEAARAALERNPDWQRQRDAVAEAGRVAERAAQKARLAEQDLAAKGKPYLADPIFAYLWKRGYGTPAYRASPLVRMLDGWAARIARFEPARRAYAMLADLPRQLATHAVRMAETAQAAAQDLAAQERQTAGLPPDAEHAALQAAVEAAEERHEAAQSALAEAEAARNRLAGTDDEATRQAVASLEAALAQAPLRALRDAALRTPMPDDDALVARLERAGAERATIEGRLPQEQAEATAAWRRLDELRALRQEARQRGVQGSGFDFQSGALVGALLGEVLRGGLSRGGFFDRLGSRQLPGGVLGDGPWGSPWGQGQGSGGFGFPPAGPWGGGLGGGGDSGGFGGDGGFRTGGGMDSGGGGFRTGGGF